MLLSAKKRKRPSVKREPGNPSTSALKSEGGGGQAPSVVKDEYEERVVKSEGENRNTVKSESHNSHQHPAIKEDPVKQEHLIKEDPDVKDELEENTTTRPERNLGKNRPIKEHLKRLRQEKAAEDAARARPIKQEMVMQEEEDAGEPQAASSLPQTKPKRRKFFSPKGSMPTSSLAAQQRRASLPYQKGIAAQGGAPQPGGIVRATSAPISKTADCAGDSGLYRRRGGSHKSIWNMAMDARRDPHLLMDLVEARTVNFINPGAREEYPTCSCGSRDTQRLGSISSRNQDVRKGEIWGSKDREDMIRYRCNQCGKSWNVEE